MQNEQLAKFQFPTEIPTADFQVQNSRGLLTLARFQLPEAANITTIAAQFTTLYAKLGWKLAYRVECIELHEDGTPHLHAFFEFPTG